MLEHLNLSLSAIEKRKATIKNKLLKDKEADIQIIEQAEKRGLIQTVHKTVLFLT
jgi:hypothetical protein